LGAETVLRLPQEARNTDASNAAIAMLKNTFESFRFIFLMPLFRVI
jgi:hypothetical protein